MKILPLAVAVLAGVNYSSQAFTVTGGDFGTTPATGDVLDVPNFFESSIASYNYNDYTTTKPTHFSTNKGRILGLDGNGAQGYVYQSIGTYSGESSLTLQCDSLFRAMPKISIIVPIFNEERQLRSVIEDLMGSPSQIEREWIFVDDSSTDKSLAILKEGQPKYAYRLIEQIIDPEGCGRAVIGIP